VWTNGVTSRLCRQTDISPEGRNEGFQRVGSTIAREPHTCNTRRPVTQYLYLYLYL
jgi:hypothetical protein